MRKIVTLFMLLAVLLVSCTAWAAEKKEVSSIDAFDQGVADTGETHFSKTEKKLVESTQPYTVAVLPYVDTSGLEGRSREMAVGAINDALMKKYPAK